MPNENPSAIALANETIRPICRKLVAARYELERAKAEVQALGGITLYPDDAEVLLDGSPDDGRAQLTNVELRTIAGFLNTTLATFDVPDFDTVLKAQAIGLD